MPAYYLPLDQTSTNPSVWWTITASTTATASIWTHANTFATSSLYLCEYEDRLRQIAALNQYHNANNNYNWQHYQVMQQIPRQPRPLAAPAILRRQSLTEEAARIRNNDQQVAERRRQRVTEQQAAWTAAGSRALDLLLSHLDEEQLKQYNHDRSFVVVGGSGQRYRILCYAGVVANIEVIGQRHRLCCHLPHGLPLADHFIAQKAMLEMDEARFVRTANRHHT